MIEQKKIKPPFSCCFQQTDELRRQLTAQQKLIEKHKDNLQKCLNVNKTLLIEKVSIHSENYIL